MGDMKKKVLSHIKKDSKEFKNQIHEEKEEIRGLKGQLKDDKKLTKQLKRK